MKTEYEGVFLHSSAHTPHVARHYFRIQLRFDIVTCQKSTQLIKLKSYYTYHAKLIVYLIH